MKNYQKWSELLMRSGSGSYYKALTGKILMFWIHLGGRFLKVITYDRWSHMLVRLCVCHNFCFKSNMI